MMRLIATCGVVAIGVAIAAIMVSSGSQGWLVGLVVSIVSVVISGADLVGAHAFPALTAPP